MIKFHPNERASIEDLLQNEAFDSFRNKEIESLPGTKIDLKMDYYPESKYGVKSEYTVKALKKFLKTILLLRLKV